MFGTNQLLSLLPQAYRTKDEAELPASSLQRHRLPDQEEMRGMELAFRENNHLTETERWRMVKEPLALWLGLLTVGTLGLHLLALLPLFWALLGGLVCGCLLALAQLLRADEVRWSKVFLALLGTPLAVVPAFFLATQFLVQRGLASLVFTVVALTLLFSAWWKAHPIFFWREWLLCADWLEPETRHTFWEQLRDQPAYVTRATIKFARNGFFSLLLLLSIVGLGGYSTRLTAFGLFFIGLFFTDFRPRQGYRSLRRMLAYAFTYTGRETGAAGVFLPQASLRQRIWFAGATVVCLHLALSTGLTLYVPTQLVMPKPAVAPPIPSPPAKKQAPAKRKRTVPSPPPSLVSPTPQGESLPSKLRTETPDTYAGMRTFLRASWQARSLSLQAFFDFVLFPLLCALVLPPLLLLAALRGFCLESDYLEGIIAKLDDPTGRTEWQWRVDRLRGSIHSAMDGAGNLIHEGSHLFLGDEYARRFAILIPRLMLRGHCYICGTTGGNKTSIGIIGILLQVMTGHTKPKENEPQPPAVTVIDMKGDIVLLITLMLRAMLLGQTFRLFTPEMKKGTYHFVPFASLHTAWRSPIQLCQIVLEALSLDHRFGYGRQFFTLNSHAALLDAIQHPSQPKSFADLYRILKKIRTGKELENCLELVRTIETLAHYPQLQPTDDKERMIDFKQGLENREVVYFWLPMSDPMTSRTIAKLAIFSLFTAALDRQRAGLPTVETYLVIDEFQRVVSQSLDVILQQARSAGITAILANQSLQDLKTPDADMRTLIKTCTRVQLYFSVTEYEARMLSEMAGKETVLLKSHGESITRVKFRRQRSRTVSYLESRQERLPIDQILRVSSDPLGMIACFGIEGGYARYGGRPVLVRTMYPLAREVYEERLKAEWPLGDGMDAEAPPAAISTPIEFEPSSVAATMDALLATELQQWQLRG